MKIKDREIKHLLRDGERSHKCPGTGVSVRALMRELTPDEEKAFFDHLLGCLACAEEFNVVSQIALETEADWRELDNLKLSDSDLEVVQRTAEEKVKRLTLRRVDVERKTLPRPKTLPAFFRHLPRMIPVTAGVLAVILGIWLVFFSSRQPSSDWDVERAGYAPQLVLLSPKGTVASLPVFRWAPYPGAEEYRLEILNTRLETEFRWDHLKEPSFPPPKKAWARIKTGRTYYWKISALDRNGRILEQNIQSFSLR